MTEGPGKYDYEASIVRERTGASGVIVMVLGGERGSGFACQLTMEDSINMPKMLRDMADQIEADVKKQFQKFGGAQ